MKLFILTVFFVLSAQSQGQSTNEVNQLAADLQAAYVSLDALSAANVSCQSDDQCQAVPVGHRICGGPGAFMVVSKNNRYVAEGIVDSLALETTKIARRLNEISGLSGICSVVLPGEVSCKASTCVMQ